MFMFDRLVITLFVLTCILYLPGMMDILPDRCSVLAKRELLYFGPFGFAAWLSGLVFVDRLNREKARNTMDMIAKLMHDNQVCKTQHSFFKLNFSAF